MKAKYFALGAGGRKFESCYPDHFKNPVKIFAGFFYPQTTIFIGSIEF